MDQSSMSLKRSARKVPCSKMRPYLYNLTQNEVLLVSSCNFATSAKISAGAN